MERACVFPARESVATREDGDGECWRQSHRSPLRVRPGNVTVFLSSHFKLLSYLRFMSGAHSETAVAK